MLELHEEKERILEVKKPNGEVLKLRLKPMTLEAMKQKDIELAEVYRKYEDVRFGNIENWNKKINQTNYLLDVIGVLIYDFNRKDFYDLTVNHLDLIRGEIEKLNEEAKKQNKKKE